MIGLLSLFLAACSSPPVVTKTSALLIESPELVPCERVTTEDAELRTNGDVWSLKDRAINLLDTCADQVDASIQRSKSK
ncbi:Rz1-like lysis system protein LysC [Pseudomonas sp. TMB3-21]